MHTRNPSLCAAKHTRYAAAALGNPACNTTEQHWHSAFDLLQFCDRVQIDAITANELAEPTELVEREAAEKDRSTVAAEISEEGKQRTVDASLPLADYKSIDK